MPFSLKNAGVTYQQAMVTLFYDMTHKEIVDYVDDMIAKSRTPKNHLRYLRKLFRHLVNYRLRLKPNKCVFKATLGNRSAS